MSSFLQQIVNGLTVGSVYALIALGYTMVYGILEFINFAHGEIYMIGAYVGIIALGGVAAWPGGSGPLGVVASFLFSIGVTGAYGYATERLAYRPLRHAPRLAPLISALGMSIFFQNYVMITQGAGERVFPVSLGTGVVAMGGVRVGHLQLAIMGTSALLMLALHFFTTRTRFGTAMRATAQDPVMARLSGIDVDRVVSATFVLGSMLAAAAGFMVGSYYGLVNFFIGYLAGLKAFIAAVLGGIGNLPGAMVGGLVLGVAETVVPEIPRLLGFSPIPFEWKDVTAFVLLVAVLIVRPSGLLGERLAGRS